MITIDTSVILAICAEEPSKPLAVNATFGRLCLAPATVNGEVANAITNMVRRARLEVASAIAVAREYRRMHIMRVPTDVPDTIELASRLGVYAYDAFVIRCALTSGTPLVSFDRRQCEVARSLHIPVIQLTPER